MRKPHWTAAEIKQLIELAGTHSDLEISGILGRPESGVHTKRLALGIPSNHYWTEDELSALHTYYQYGASVVARRIGRGKNAVKAMACRLGLRDRSWGWSAEDEELVRQKYGKVPTSEIVVLIGRRACTIYAKVRTMGLSRSRLWTAEENELIRQKYGKAPIDELAAQLDRKVKTVREHARRLGLAKRRVVK